MASCRRSSSLFLLLRRRHFSPLPLPLPLPSSSSSFSSFHTNPRLPPTPTFLADHILFRNQSKGISTSHAYLRSEKPVPSPLTIVPQRVEVGGEKDGRAAKKKKKGVEEEKTARCILKNIKQSPKKVNLVAKLIRGMRVEDALLQLAVTIKRAAKTVTRVICGARNNASHNHGLDRDRLIVAEAFVGKGLYRKFAWPHAKGKAGIRVRPSCRLTVIVQEMSAEQEAELARLRAMNFRERALHKRNRLLPHKLIEVRTSWHRRPRETALAS